MSKGVDLFDQFYLLESDQKLQVVIAHNPHHQQKVTGYGWLEFFTLKYFDESLFEFAITHGVLPSKTCNVLLQMCQFQQVNRRKRMLRLIDAGCTLKSHGNGLVYY